MTLKDGLTANLGALPVPDHLHYIRCANGKLGAEPHTSAAGVDEIIGALKESGKKCLVIHCHGGLVSAAQGLTGAIDLNDKYLKANAYPVFYIWESSVFDTIRNNWREWLSDNAFIKAYEWIERVLNKRGRGSVRFATTFGVSRDPYAVFTLDENWDSIQPSEEEKAEAIAVEGQLREKIAAKRPTDARFALHINWFSLWQVALKVGKRLIQGRGHCLYATIIEELVRATFLDEVARGIWGAMKKDCKDPFQDGPDDFAGTALLQRLEDGIKNRALQIERIVVVGHSAGSHFISNWIAETAKYPTLQNLKVDAVFLAPAVTYRYFKETVLDQHRHVVRNFRMFSMRDNLELRDQVWGENVNDIRRLVYPSSLLYLISGVLEQDADEPVLGMERFYGGRPYSAEKFPDIEIVRNWFVALPNMPLVWSETPETALPGQQCHSHDHGAFKSEPFTLASLEELVFHGF